MFGTFCDAGTTLNQQWMLAGRDDKFWAINYMTEIAFCLYSVPSPRSPLSMHHVMWALDVLGESEGNEKKRGVFSALSFQRLFIEYK